MILGPSSGLALLLVTHGLVLFLGEHMGPVFQVILSTLK